MNKTPEERIADCIAAAIVVVGFLYVFGHVIAAWMAGAFQVVNR